MPEPVTAIIAGTAAVGSAVAGAVGSSKAAKAQKDAAKKAAQTQKETLAAQTALTAPYTEAGKNALAQYQGLAPYQSFGMAQFQTDPGYNFRMSEGIKALERSASARGLLQSGGTLKGITQFGQNLASQEYENAFTRYLQEREARLDPYRYLTTQGQAAAVGQAANVGEGLTSLGNIAAQREVTQGNIASGLAGNIGGAISGLAGAYGDYSAAQPYQNYLASITPATSAYNPRYMTPAFGGPK